MCNHWAEFLETCPEHGYPQNADQVFLLFFQQDSTEYLLSTCTSTKENIAMRETQAALVSAPLLEGTGTQSKMTLNSETYCLAK